MSTTMIANSSSGLRLSAPFAGTQPIRRSISAPRARCAVRYSSCLPASLASCLVATRASYRIHIAAQCIHAVLLRFCCHLPKLLHVQVRLCNPGRAAVGKAGGWSMQSHQTHCLFVQQFLAYHKPQCAYSRLQSASGALIMLKRSAPH